MAELKHPKYHCQECGAQLMVIQDVRFDEYALINEEGKLASPGRESGKDHSGIARVECSVHVSHTRAAEGLSAEEYKALSEAFYEL